jgi:hypothetical protein
MRAATDQFLEDTLQEVDKQLLADVSSEQSESIIIRETPDNFRLLVMVIVKERNAD